MADQSGFNVETKFIKGLVTESTALNFPTDAATDTLNCVYGEFGRVTRRPGVDLEMGYSEKSITKVTAEIWTEYVWYVGASSANRAFLVQQKGKTLYFYDVTGSTVVSTPGASLSLDLTNYQPSGSTLDPATYGCRYASGNSRLFVGNGACNPFYVVYDDDAGTISATEITIKYRDIEGLDDGLDVDERLTKSASGLATDNPEHYYNLYNQGWYISDALSQWDTARTDMPSNADMVGYYRSSATDAFDNARVTGKSPGTGAAPKGHYILEVGIEDRASGVVADGGAALSFPGGVSKYSITGKSRIGSSWSNYSRLNDSDKANPTSISTANPYAGVDLGSGSAQKIFSVRLYPWTGGTDDSERGFIFSSVSNSSTNISITLYGSNTSPSSSTDGTLLGSYSGTDGTSPVTIVSSDTSNTYRYVWARFSTNVASPTWLVTEMEVYLPGVAVKTYERPNCLAFFAGRVWYAGLNQGVKGSNLYFSQVAIDDTRYGLCYQKNDPTSEDFADLLADDGGVVNIPEMGKVQNLYSFQSQLMVFADNGVWLIKGGGSNSFSATGYLVQRITNIGMTSPYSIVDVKGVPCWWGEDGIYTIQYKADYDSTTIQSLTEDTIKTRILTVPSANKPYIKSAFDRVNNTIYWTYNDDEDADQDTVQQPNNILIFNAKSSAFYPWSIDDSVANTPKLQGICYVQDGSRSDAQAFMIKFPVTYTRSATTYLTYADFSDRTNWKDWHEYNTLISSSTNEIDYSSYLVSGYRIDGQAMRNFQSKYIWTFMEDETNASLWLKGRFDFTNNANSGKWSTPQQVYNSLTTKGRQYDDIRISRRVVRGSGKALQLHYYSESGKPFTLIGWGLFESGVDAA